MENLVTELKNIQSKAQEIEPLIVTLAQLLPNSDRYPVGLEKDRKRLGNMENWFDHSDPKVTEALKEIMFSCLVCLKNAIYLRSLLYVAKFRIYKEDTINVNKLLPKQDQQDDIPYTVTCRLIAWGASIYWRKIINVWGGKGKRQGVRSNYLPLPKGAYKHNLTDFKDKGEHKDLYEWLEDKFGKFRKDSALLAGIAKSLNLLSNNED